MVLVAVLVDRNFSEQEGIIENSCSRIQNAKNKRKPLQTLCLQGFVERNVRFDTVLPCVTFWGKVTL